MKKYVLILLMIAVPIIGQEKNTQTQMNFPYVNNSLKMYMALGLPVGFGLLYAPEFRSSINSHVLHVINFDMKFLGVDVAADIVNSKANLLLVGFGFSVQYSIGTLLANGGRLYLDLFGIGYNAGIIEGKAYISINALGFQNTLSNGFYWGLRTQINLSRGLYNQIGVGVGAYVAIGYDFGKKINPKDYESRMK